MDYRRERGFPSDNVVHILSGNGANENWGANEDDQAIWATEDEYGIWNNETAYDARAPQSRSGSETPSKRSKISQSGDLTGPNRSKAIGKMFYKTKLCCKFRVGTCPYVTNCNFAHNIEELRKPPPNWQEIVAAHDEDRGVSSEPREEYQIPIFGVSEEPQRNYKGRHCKKFYTEEGCPYGENCTFLHDEHSKSRESVVISLGPGSGAGYGSISANANVVTLKPSNWKTRICNKWELTGYCPFGTKCHFAHRAAELHRYGGGPMDSEVKDSSTPEGGAFPARPSVDTGIAPMITAVPHFDNYHMAPPNTVQSVGRKPNQKWKGPEKISKIYGDWIDDL